METAVAMWASLLFFNPENSGWVSTLVNLNTVRQKQDANTPLRNFKYG